mgnify:CR=1 FL=1
MSPPAGVGVVVSVRAPRLAAPPRALPREAALGGIVVAFQTRRLMRLAGRLEKSSCRGAGLRTALHAVSALGYLNSVPVKSENATRNKQHAVWQKNASVLRFEKVKLFKKVAGPITPLLSCDSSRHVSM